MEGLRATHYNTFHKGGHGSHIRKVQLEGWVGGLGATCIIHGGACGRFTLVRLSTSLYFLSGYTRKNRNTALECAVLVHLIYTEALDDVGMHALRYWHCALGAPSVPGLAIVD